MWVKLRSLRKSFTYASKGLRYAFAHEQNFRIQLVIALVVILLMVVLPIKAWEAVALIFVIVSVLILEIANTVVERFVDLLKPRLHHYSEIIKDMMAAAVLIVSVGAVIAGIIIFYPYVISS